MKAKTNKKRPAYKPILPLVRAKLPRLEQDLETLTLAYPKGLPGNFDYSLGMSDVSVDEMA